MSSTGDSQGVYRALKPALVLELLNSRVLQTLLFSRCCILVVWRSWIVALLCSPLVIFDTVGWSCHRLGLSPDRNHTSAPLNHPASLSWPTINQCDLMSRPYVVTSTETLANIYFAIAQLILVEPSLMRLMTVRDPCHPGGFLAICPFLLPRCAHDGPFSSRVDPSSAVRDVKPKSKTSAM